MLRSIIAVWSVALALLIIAATAGCEWGGCANGDDCSVGIGYDVRPDMAKPPACPLRCGACPTGDTCFSPSAAVQLPAFCAHECADDRDCGATEKCVALIDAQLPSVCVSAGTPVGCTPAYAGWHCDFPPRSCKDADTAQLPYADTTDRVCGLELVHCTNGCRNGACV
jgi:hypothetical protein